VAEIQWTIAALQPLTIQLHHIKGHQDQKTSTQNLTLPAQLNIECDSRANHKLPELQNFSVFLPHPSLPAAYPYLQVHNKLIIRWATDALRHAATTPDYKSYMEKKHEWTTDDSAEVNWNAITLAMKHIKSKTNETYKNISTTGYHIEYPSDMDPYHMNSPCVHPVIKPRRPNGTSENAHTIPESNTTNDC